MVIPVFKGAAGGAQHAQSGNRSVRARRSGTTTNQPFKKLFAMVQISGRVAQASVVQRWLPFGRIVILTSDPNSIPGATEEFCESRPTQPSWATCRDSQSCPPKASKLQL